ncbi:MAG TPA: Sua5/YciO/YrdC/YwlC family protein, partial [Actinomycetota bacterium]|nr:Sua5/YciO/YrdC/YwlC family protein [Actinomycetota bacterium]
MTTIEEAAAVLRDGGLVVIPTDTVYGVACSPLSETAVAAIFALKGRPTEKPLPVLGDGPDALAAVARFDEPAVGMARAYWPGPLTLVL